MGYAYWSEFLTSPGCPDLTQTRAQCTTGLWIPKVLNTKESCEAFKGCYADDYFNPKSEQDCLCAGQEYKSYFTWTSVRRSNILVNVQGEWEAGIMQNLYWQAPSFDSIRKVENAFDFIALEAEVTKVYLILISLTPAGSHILGCPRVRVGICLLCTSLYYSRHNNFL